MFRSKDKQPNDLTRLQRFGLVFYDRFKLTLIIWLVLAIFGALSYTTFLKREGFPAVAPSIGSITGTYFVNDSQKVDAEVTKPLSDFLQKRSDTKKVNTSSGNNFYFVQVEYKEGTDATKVSAELQEQVKQQRVLPAAATAEFKPFIFGLTEEGDDLLVSLYSKKIVSAEQLQAKMKEAADFLRNDDELKSITERVKPLDLYRTGVSPINGEPINEQKSFDRVGVRNGSVSFYQSGIIAISSTASVDDLELYDRSERALERLRASEKFKEYDAVISADYAESIRAQVGNLQENLLGGMLAVIIVSFLLISLRASIVTALSMVTVLLITLGTLLVIGETLNTITLFSLILCLGLIVDDTTIMVEAIDASTGSTKSRREIVSDAIKRVARASTAGTLTTMLAFAPMLFISGILGSFIIAIPLTIIISLAMSLLVSLTLIPFLARFLISNEKSGNHIASLSPLKGVETAVSNVVAGVIRIGHRSRRLLAVIAFAMITLSIVLTIAGGSLFSKLKFNIFPPSKDSDSLLVNLQFPRGTTLSDAQEITDEANIKIAQTLGDNLRRVSLYTTGSDSKVTVYLDLLSYEKREVRAPELVQNLEAAFVDFKRADVSAAQVDVGPPAGGFGARIYYDQGQRENALKLAADVKAYLKDNEVTRIDGSKAKLEKVQIANESNIARTDGKQYVEVLSSFDADDTSALVSLAQTLVEKQFPKDKVASYGLNDDAVKFDFGSESENQESFKAMVIAFPILLLVMYMLLAFQFRSLLQPLLIFLAIPFSIFGITNGLYLTNNPFSFFTLIGVFALIGISVNNTILLTDYANQERKAGKDSIEAIASAVKARFRPLLTTSITSVVALIPLALSDPFWESLAVTLIFGLLSSTFLVIVAFPYYYLAADVVRSKFSRKAVLGWLLLLIAGLFLSSRLGINLLVFVAMYIVLTIGKYMFTRISVKAKSA